MDITGCPECGVPAEVTDRFVVDSTDGPVEHVRIRCADRHWFLLPLASLCPSARRAAAWTGAGSAAGRRSAA